MDSKAWDEKNHGGRALVFLLLLIVLVLGIGIGTVISTKVGAERKQGLQTSNGQPISFAGNSIPLQGFSEVAKAIEPAVVNISTQALLAPTARNRGGKRPRSDDWGLLDDDL